MISTQTVQVGKLKKVVCPYCKGHNTKSLGASGIPNVVLRQCKAPKCRRMFEFDTWYGKFFGR